MKAIVQDRYGEADVLRLEELPVPTPGRGEVLVEVRAAGVDPGVWHLMAGRPRVVRLASGIRRPRQRVPGSAFAGIVVALGEGVDDLRVGDEVFGMARGAFAEYAVARADKVAPKPAAIAFDVAAAIPISGPTALQSLRDAVRLAPGEHLLVLGAAGGVGSYAVQLATAMGARVTGASSAAKVDLVSQLGADRAIDYTRQDPLALGPYDAIVDTGGGRTLASLRRALAPRGRIAIVGAESGPLGGLGRLLAAPLASALSGHRIVGVVSIENRADLEALSAAVGAGTVVPPIDRVFPLERAADAVRHIGRGHGRGKTLVQVA